jgi:hypothetical protein
LYHLWRGPTGRERMVGSRLAMTDCGKSVSHDAQS